MAKTQKATFAAGCFWGIEAAFKKLKGVTKTEVGYMGGDLDNPSYEQVCTDKTGHAEVVQLDFDPNIISYEELLETFWQIHDPTQLNRQGPDIGTQYRSAIFYHNEEQKAAAEKSKQQQDKKVVTLIEPAKTFYKAEEYHQDYYGKQGINKC